MPANPGFDQVAARLRAFYREPARWRPRYLHGQEPLPEGGVVLRLALAADANVPGASDPQLAEAAAAFVRQVCLAEHATHYQVLCLPRGAGREAIREHYRLLMALLHPDRRAPGPAWPADGAHRVNAAQATLLDDALRRQYDDALRADPPAAASPRGPRPRARIALVRFARRAMVVVAMLVAVFMVQAWWVDDLPQRHSLLERSFTVESSSRWMRDALADAGLPRFLQASPVAFEPLPSLPLSAPAPKLAALDPAAIVLPRDPAPVAVAPLPAAPRSTPRAPGFETPAAPAPPPARGVFPAAMAAPLVRIAQAPETAPAAAGTEGPMAIHVETLVALLVGYYEAGDVDALMGLYDPEALGFWDGMRTRSAFGDFFDATSQRQLRLDRLTWRGDARAAQARGDAQVLARYREGGRPLERAVLLEFEVALREGQPRLTRLHLFPAGS